MFLLEIFSKTENFFSYPLSHLILSGNLPLQIWSRTPNITTGNLAPNDPFCYVQQVVLRTAVIPWEQNLTIGDAFRAPLYESFKLLDIVRNFEDAERCAYTKKSGYCV